MFQVGEFRPVDMNAIRTGFLTAVYSGGLDLPIAIKLPQSNHDHECHDASLASRV
jgi:hypothetical protein